MKIKSEDYFYIRLLIFVIGFLLLFSTIIDNINIYDEGISIYGAENVLNGKMPYQDLWTIYAPGQFYLNAIALDIFGNNLFTFRFLSIMLNFSVCIVIFILARKIFDEKYAFVAFAISIIWFATMPMFGRAVTSGILAVLISNYFLFKFFELNDKKMLFFAGIMIGITALFRHEMAGYIYGAIFWAVFFSGMPNKDESSEPLKYRIIKGLLNGIIFTLGVLFVFLPIALYFLSTVDNLILYRNLIEIPFTIFREYRSLPLPNPLNSINGDYSILQRATLFWEGIIFYLPLISFGLTAYFLYWRVRRKKLKLNGEIFWKEMLLFNIGLNFYNQALIRSDIEHLLPSFLIFTILFISLLRIIPYPKLTKLLVIIVSLFVISFPIAKKLQNVKLIIDSKTEKLSSQKANFILGKSEFINNYNKLLDYIKNNTSTNDYIYSGNLRNDKLISNDVMIYYLSQRKSATKYYESHPGITTIVEIQQEIIDSLISKNVRMLILLNQDAYSEPNKSSKSSNVFLLDNFIRENYTKTQEYNEYSVWEKDK